MNGWELIKHIVDTAYDHYIVTFIFIFLWRCGSMQFHEHNKIKNLKGFCDWGHGIKRPAPPKPGPPKKEDDGEWT